jgi:signal transduction histidine kinase
LRQLQSTYSFNQKQQELELLKKINEANLLVIRQQKYIGIAFTFIILLLGSLAFIGFRTGMHRKRVNQKLYNSNTELERLNTIKDKLFSVISHDLRGPVKNLSSVLALFKEGHLSQDEFVQLSGKLGHQLEVSGNALENLLHWAKAQLSDHKTEPEKIVVADIAGKVAQQLKESIETKKLQFSNELEPQLVAWADKNQVEIILRNLVANAVKFTREGGAIKITGKGVDDHVEVCVEDSGIGMTAPAIQNLFQPGHHFTTSGTNQEKGTGIGLLITKEMVANNGGSIQVDSSRNRGTRFTFTLPLRG